MISMVIAIAMACLAQNEKVEAGTITPNILNQYARKSQAQSKRDDIYVSAVSAKKKVKAFECD